MNLQLEDKLYTSTEVAEILGVSLRSIYRYLEDGKLDAEVKTATGRHRFTKSNILDFLQPSVSRAKVQVATAVEDEIDYSQISAIPADQPANAETVDETAEADLPEVAVDDINTDDAVEDTTIDTSEVAEEVLETENQEAQVAEETIEPEETAETAEVDDASSETEEPVDWLKKFREAAEKHRAEEAQKAPQAPAPAEQPVVAKAEAAQSEPVAAAPKAEEPVAKAEESPYRYYRSGVGGL